MEQDDALTERGLQVYRLRALLREAFPLLGVAAMVQPERCNDLCRRILKELDSETMSEGKDG